MKVECLYDQGNAEFPEDVMINHFPFFGVVDGFSPILGKPRKFYKYLGETPYEVTGGQLVSYYVSQEFWRGTEEGLKAILNSANLRLRHTLDICKVKMDDPSSIPGACFLVVKIGPKFIDFIQGGDCLAVWKNKDGTIFSLTSQCYEYEIELLKIKRKMMRENQLSCYPEALAENRRKHYNQQGGFSVLNGEYNFLDFSQRFTLETRQIDTLILFSDGFVPLEWTVDPFILSGNVFDAYSKKGLEGILAKAHEAAKEKNGCLPEATAMFIKM